MNINAFDIRTMLLAKHAQHVVLIHFPIALCTTAVAFDFLALRTKSTALLSAAYLNLLLAASSTLPVVATGLAAWRWALEGQALKGILLFHLLLGCFSTLLIWAVFWIHFTARRHPQESLPSYRLPVEALSLLVMGLTAHLGGLLTGVNGPS